MDSQINLGKKLGSGQSSFVWYSHPSGVQGTKWVQVKITGTARAYCLIDQMVNISAPQCFSQMNQSMPSKGIYKKEFVQCFFTSFFGTGEWSNSLVDVHKGQSPDILAEAWARALGTIDGLISLGDPGTASFCLDVSGGNLYNGNQLDIWKCQDSNPNQQVSERATVSALRAAWEYRVCAASHRLLARSSTVCARSSS